MSLFDGLTMLTKDEREFVKNSGDKNLKKRMRAFSRLRYLVWGSLPITTTTICSNIYDMANVQKDHFNAAMCIKKQMLNEQLINNEITAEEFDTNVEEIEKEVKKFNRNMKINTAIKQVALVTTSAIGGAVTIKSIDLMAQSELYEAMESNKVKKNIEEPNPAETMKKFISGGNKKSES